ncbi:MAG TPA: hypothetical protein VN452_02415 [Longilinea sp.]|nr:hypothetical protein [Longilinea sp.]
MIAVKEPMQMDAFEDQLFKRLKPMQPRPEFVDHLRFRLENPPNTVVEPPSWKTGVLILATGLVGGFIVFALARKMLRWLFHQ